MLTPPRGELYSISTPSVSRCGITARMALDTLIQSMAILRRQAPQTILLIAGQAPFETISNRSPPHWISMDTFDFWALSPMNTYPSTTRLPTFSSCQRESLKGLGSSRWRRSPTAPLFRARL